MKVLSFLISRPRKLFSSSFIAAAVAQLRYLLKGKKNNYIHPSVPVVYYDVTRTIQTKRTTGVQRVVRRIYEELARNAISYEVQPVVGSIARKEYVTVDWDAARNKDRGGYYEIVPENGDIFLSFDIAWNEQLILSEAIGRYKKSGCRIVMGVHDLLPIEFESYFPKNVGATQLEWLKTISRFASFICVSKTTQKRLEEILRIENIDVSVDHIYLGGDFKKIQSGCKRDNPGREIKNKEGCFKLLAVGTVEPRKGYALLLETYKKLRARGEKVSLTIVGKKGWMSDAVIGEIKRLRKEDYNFHWLANASDEKLEECYNSADALIVASEGEGFGLPVIEGIFREIPLIIRDIEVFKEVVPIELQRKVVWFGGKANCTLEEAITRLTKNPKEFAIDNRSIHINTWCDSCHELRKLLKL